ncbi:MAG: DUF3047 domain-containing protein [Proteobacteria bacterium]|nr:DUF3047 domain-containing protein [Pseudomonadota bacterium]MBU1711069.1 DUF3047 domain-containing protein [Pseudomonadota bacterium]
MKHRISHYPRHLCIVLFAGAVLFGVFAVTGGEEILVIDDFVKGISSHWQEKSFKGHTFYQAANDGGRFCIKAQSDNSASGLFYKIEYSAVDYPLLTWEWKVEKTISAGDARHKSGDDYAARIYVVFPSILFWKTRALNYIWANKLEKGASLPNAFTANAYMIAVESGPEQTGKWLTETRNVYEDYKNSFGEEPPKVGAIAIMTDTDNTGEQASAYYGKIFIQRSMQ